MITLKEYIQTVLSEAVLGTKVEAVLRHLRSLDTKNEIRGYLEENFEMIGIGSSRQVFAIDDEFVIKFDNGGLGEASGYHNKIEANAKIQGGLGYMFPKVYDHAKNYSWLLAERVNHRFSESQWLAAIGIKNSVTFDKIKTLSKFLSRLEDLLEWEPEMSEEEAVVAVTKKYFKRDERYVNFDDEIESIKGILDLPFVRGMRDMYRQYDLALWDVRAANVGMTFDGRPVIIDWAME